MPHVRPDIIALKVNLMIHILSGGFILTLYYYSSQISQISIPRHALSLRSMGFFPLKLSSLSLFILFHFQGRGILENMLVPPEHFPIKKAIIAKLNVRLAHRAISAPEDLVQLQLVQKVMRDVPAGPFLP